MLWQRRRTGARRDHDGPGPRCALFCIERIDPAERAALHPRVFVKFRVISPPIGRPQFRRRNNPASPGAWISFSSSTVIASLFLVIGAAEPLAARLRLPYSVILAVLGVLIGAGAIFFLRTNMTDALNPVAEAILGLPIRSNVFLYVFLPTLLFQATLVMNLRRMLDDWVPILVLAVVAVVVATLSVGYALVMGERAAARGLPSDRRHRVDDRSVRGRHHLPVDIGAAPAGADHRGRKPSERRRRHRALRSLHGLRDAGRARIPTWATPCHGFRS